MDGGRAKQTIIRHRIVLQLSQSRTRMALEDLKRQIPDACNITKNFGALRQTNL